MTLVNWHKGLWSLPDVREECRWIEQIDFY